MLAAALDPADPAAEGFLGRTLQDVEDWGQLTNTASRQGMAGLPYRRAAEQCPECVPSGVLAEWRHRATEVAQRSLQMQRQLLHLIDALESGGVPTIAFKGPVSSEVLYGDSTLRSFVDVDLLVHPSDAESARSIALSLGYVEEYPFHAVDRDVREKGEPEIGFRHVSTGLLMEIHWRIRPRLTGASLPASALFARSQVIRLMGRRIRVLGPEDTALMLAVHASAHGWNRIEDLASAGAALSHADVDGGSALLALARQHGCTRRVHVAALLVEALVGARTPESVVTSACNDRLARWMTRLLGNRVVRGIGPDRDDFSRFGRVGDTLLQTLSLDDCKGMLSFVWGRLLVPGANDWMTWDAKRVPAMRVWRRQWRVWRK